MSQKLFLNPENIISEVSEMERDEFARREDRATVADFYNGQPPYSQSEADALGLQINVNNLFGYSHLNTAKDQLLALYTAPPRIWEVQLDTAPPAKKRAWESKATQHWNRVMKDSGRLKYGYEFVAGDSTMHGEGMFWFPNTSDWCPSHCSLARRLIPSLSTLNMRELTHFAVNAEMPFKDAVRYADRGGKGWNKPNLKALLKRVFTKQGANLSGDSRTVVDQTNVELMTYNRQANAQFDRMWKYTIPVVYFFQVNYDQSTFPWDVTILSRDALAGANDQGKAFGGQAVLFEKDAFFPTIHQALFPMHMSSAIGGEPYWHRVKGLGHLNYSLSWHLEVLFNRALQAAHEQCTTFFQAADSASREVMEQILLKHNGIIPEGISLVQNRVGSDFQGLLSLVQLIRQQGATNANDIAPNDGQDNMLQVQAQFQQNMVGAQSSNRIAHWFDYMNRLGKEVFRRFTNLLIAPIDTGYSEIMAFQAAMAREGIPLAYLQPANVQITTARMTGNGVRQNALAAASAMMDKIQLFGPDAQQDIKRDFVGAALDDYARAEKLVPYTDKPDHSQVLDAESENNVFAVQQKPMPVDDGDEDQIHVATHFDYMASLLRKGIQAGQKFTAEQMGSFQAAGAHVVMHVRKIQPVDKDLGAKFMGELNKLAALAQKMVNNTKQAAQAQAEDQSESGKPISAAEKAKLALDAAKVHQNQQKIDFGKEKFVRTQALREHTAATHQLIDMQRDNRDEHQTRQEMAIKDAQAAAGIAPEPVTP